MTLTPEREAEYRIEERHGVYFVLFPDGSGRRASGVEVEQMTEIDRLRGLAEYHADLHGQAAKDARALFVRADRLERAIREAEQLMHDGQSAKAWEVLQDALEDKS